MRCRLVGLLLLFLLAGCSGRTSSSSPVVVFAAASTGDVLNELAGRFEKETGTRVEISPGPSSGLARQVLEGAPVHLFLSADQASAEALAARNLIDKRRVLLRNRLVVIVPADSGLQIKSLADLADPRVKKLALAEEKVPAGEYARQALRKADVWDRVKDRVLGGTDVRVTRQLVEQGADAGLVYATDARGDPRLRVAYEVPEDLHQPIEYPLVLLRPANAAAVAFYNYLGTEEAAAAFRKAGFQVE